MAPRVNDNIIDYLRDKGKLDKHFLWLDVHCPGLKLVADKVFHTYFFDLQMSPFFSFLVNTLEKFHGINVWF